MLIKNTIVFQKNWEAINALDENGNRKYRYIINQGSSRSSKTYSLIDCFDLYCRENKDKRMTAWRDTKVDAKKTILNDTLKRLKSTNRYKVDQGFNKTESIFNYNTDSTFEIHGTDDEETVHGLTQDAAWLNEPYKISRDTFDQIDQRTSDFIFIDWNPKKNHWIDDIKKDPRAIVIHSTFKDNPFCPIEQRRKILSYQPVKLTDAVNTGLISESEAQKYDAVANVKQLSERQLKEIIRCQENEYKKSANEFKWVVYGLGEKAERPNRIFNWNEISYSEYLQINAPVIYGVDWGAVDPFGIVEAKYYDGKLYVNELNYLSENELKEKLSITERAQINKEIDEGFVMWFFNKLGIDKTRPIVCDNNRPAKIIALRNAGFDKAVATEKYPGSVIDGIDLLNNIDVYYTSNSVNLKYEQENYSRQVDRYGVVQEEPEDKDNHCFTGDTNILTRKGYKKIKDIKFFDRVLTSKGFKPVLKKWNNGTKKITEYSIQFDTLSLSLKSTDNHLIKTNKGWKKISQLKKGETVYLFNPTKEKNTNFTKGKDIIQEGAKECILSYGKQRQKEKSQKDFMCIIKTATRLIIELTILNWFVVKTIYQNTQNKDIKTILNGLKNFMLKALRLQRAGINHLRVLNGIENKQLRQDSAIDNMESQNAMNAELHTLKTIHPIASAQTIVNQNLEENQELMMRLEHVYFAQMNSQSINIQELKVVDVIATQIENEPVYDLTVFDCHEYFANNILVHNCIDPTRYIAQLLKKHGIIRTL